MSFSIYMHMHTITVYLFTSKIYGTALVWKHHPTTILTWDQGTIEVYSSTDCCSWCNWSCHHFCDIKLKRGIRDHSTQATSSKSSRGAKGCSTPIMYSGGNCTGKRHCLPRTWSLHTGLQLSVWNWRWMTSGSYLISIEQVANNQYQLLLKICTNAHLSSNKG